MEPYLASLSVCPGESNETQSQCLTLSEIIDSLPGVYGMFQHQEEVIFLPDTPIVNETTSIVSKRII